MNWMRRTGRWKNGLSMEGGMAVEIGSGERGEGKRCGQDGLRWIEAS